MLIDPDRDPSDDRTDEEAIAEHKQYIAMLNYKQEPMSEEHKARWDAVNAKRLAAQQGFTIVSDKSAA